MAKKATKNVVKIKFRMAKTVQVEQYEPLVVEFEAVSTVEDGVSEDDLEDIVEDLRLFVKNTLSEEVTKVLKAKRSR